MAWSGRGEVCGLSRLGTRKDKAAVPAVEKPLGPQWFWGGGAAGGEGGWGLREGATGRGRVRVGHAQRRQFGRRRTDSGAFRAGGIPSTRWCLMSPQPCPGVLGWPPIAFFFFKAKALTSEREHRRTPAPPAPLVSGPFPNDRPYPKKSRPGFVQLYVLFSNRYNTKINTN